MRLFIATTFPADILRDLNDRVARIRPRLPPASWVREDAQHLTLAFLGEQPQSIIEYLAAPLAVALASVASFEAQIHASGVFPNVRHARVGWAGLHPIEPFNALSATVRAVVARCGIALDGADFRPHLTLMRMREGWPPASIELFTKSLRDYRSASFVVERVTLFSSQLNPKGAIHRPEKVFELKT